MARRKPARTFKLRDKAVLIDDQGREVGEVDAIRIRFYDEPEPGPGEQLAAIDTPGEVWAEYVRLLNPRNKTLGSEERRLIQAALKVATPEELKRAFYGCTRSSWHMNTHPETKGKNFHRLSHIIKGKRGGKTMREQIDFFLEIAEKGDGGSGVTSATSARVLRAKRDVRDGVEFPRDEHVVRRAAESKAWLEEQGWTIGEEDGSATFLPPSS